LPQLPGVPEHRPLVQRSLAVQGSPSLQAATLVTCTQPLAGLHESSVQALPSPHTGGPPPRQTPPVQVSLVVQASPSSQGLVLFTCVQPSAWSQASSVHPLPSLQSGGGPPTQAPSAHVSLVVQALPSSQAAVLFSNTQSPP